MKAEKPPQVLVCYCCRETYVRGQWKCCKPPSDMAAHRWREQYCTTCRKCPRHCACEKRTVEESPRDRDPLDMSRLQEILKSPEVKEWMPFKEREPGSDDC